jgi:hypothetical protein
LQHEAFGSTPFTVASLTIRLGAGCEHREGGDAMVAVEQPRADCGHVAVVTQQCGKCLRWCCPECYTPWTALACGACRAEARAAAANPYQVEPAPLITVTVAAEPPGDARCRDRSAGTRGAAGPHRHRGDRERADVRSLAARVADLERRLQELRPGP